MIADDVVVGGVFVDGGNDEAGDEERKVDDSLTLEVVFDGDAYEAFESLPEADGEEDEDKREDGASKRTKDRADDIAKKGKYEKTSGDGGEIDEYGFHIGIAALILSGVLEN
jgi:hypothetical protein